MIPISISFFTSFLCTFLILKYQKYHIKYTVDKIQDSAQKIHTQIIPRIGGISIFLGALIGLLFLVNYSNTKTYGLTILLSSSTCFLIGLLEDIKKNISIRIRLFFTLAAAAVAIYILEMTVDRIDITILQPIFSSYEFQVLFTLFCIVGLSNAYNIIDGLNGLSSMIAIVSLAGLSYVCLAVGDYDLLRINAIICAATIGFFFINYPMGLIFLGDGGAYLLGFLIATSSILLVQNNPSVSPWLPLLINIYPITETLFSIYRRIVHGKKNPLQPDGAHIHTLIYRRIIDRNNSNNFSPYYNNSKASPYLWALSASATIPALIFWNRTHILIFFVLLFISIYIWIYRRIIKFKTPKWLYTLS